LDYDYASSEGLGPKEIRSMLVGKDAAGNELDTPPEVFAPAFRVLNRAGLDNTTYHAGEDFRHLVSGLRAVDEAVTFLEMKAGDRIGHGTALGICPGLWKNRIGRESICWCFAGEWLDNLVWLCDVLRQEGHKTQIPALHLEIERFFYDVYGRHGFKAVPHHTLLEAWKMRGLDPRFIGHEAARQALEGRLEGRVLTEIQEEAIKKMSLAPDANDNAEVIELILAIKKNRQAFELFRAYHYCSEVRKSYNQIIKRPLGDDELGDEILMAAQDHVIKKLNKQKILVEVMPTSNRRISFYENYGEHHFINWLCPTGRNDRPTPIATIASDDPGIFATSLRNEYSHVVNALKRYCHFTSDDAYAAVTRLHENAKAFAFKTSWKEQTP
jgi:adenosine deaminase